MIKLMGTVAFLSVSAMGIGASYDLVVYGGTAGGVATAVAGAREGLNVALLEPTNHIGGMVTGGLGATDHGNKKCIGGFALEFYERLGKFYNKPIAWRPEPHVAEETLNAMLKEAGVNLFLNHRLQEHDGITSEGLRITSVKMENGSTFEGEIFADCSYEGDLMAKSGVKYTWGREGQGEYGEELAGVRDRTPLHQFVVETSARDKDGRLLPLVQDIPKGETGSADKKVQAYNFRMCLTRQKDNQVPFPKPSNYNQKDWDLLARYIAELTSAEMAVPDLKKFMSFSILDSRKGEGNRDKTDSNNKGPISTDFIGGSWGYPDATYAERQEIWDAHYNYVAGFYYFLANDPRVPKGMQDEMNKWGLAADEFKDTNHWPRQLYVREGRRMIGEYVMTQKDIQTDYLKDDVIGMGSYKSDSHNVARFENANGFAENEGDMQVSVTPYHIPYRMITPKRDQVENLLVPVTFSASHVAYSTIRMEPQYMIIGQAAGVAASMAAKADTAIQDVNTMNLKTRLSELKAVLKLDEYVTTGSLN